MNLSTAGARLIEQFEGFMSRPYQDVVGVWTIGYGSTAGVGPHTPPVTKVQAESRLKSECNKLYGKAVNDLGVKLNQNQFDALVSFVYNCGVGAISVITTVGKRLRAKDWSGAMASLLTWDKAGGKINDGLRDRRLLERKLFLKPVALEGYTDSEIRWIREYDQLKHEHKDHDRQMVLQRYMFRQRVRIWHIAENDHSGAVHGWSEANREARYKSLRARTPKKLPVSAKSA